MKKNSNLRRILITVLLIVAIIGTTFFMAFRIYKLAETQCWDRLYDGSCELNEAFTQKMLGEGESLGAIADRISKEEDLKGEDVRKQMQGMRSGVTISPIRLLFEDGTMINENGQDETLDVGETFVRLSATTTYFTGVEKDIRFSDISCMLCVAPVMKNDRPAALLVKYINIQALPALVKTNGLGGAMRVAVADGNTYDLVIDSGHKKYYEDIDDFFNNNVIMDRRPARVVDSIKQADKRRLVFFDEETGKRMYMYTMPSFTYKWLVMAYIEEEIVFANSNNIKRLFTLFGVLEVIILAAYLIWIMKDTLAQIDRVVLQERLEKAEQAERAKTTFLFNMSHDIRTPMNAIMGYTGIARTHMDDRERVADCLDKIHISGVHLLELINDVLDMARIESGNVVIDEKPVNIKECAEGVIIMCKALANMRRVSLRFKAENLRDVNVYADEVHINEVLMNVMSNAIKYTESGGEVTLKVRQVEPFLEDMGKFEFVVEDNGIGMTKEFLEKIYDTFARERNSTVSGIEGTGLGMSIVKRLVELMGGTIGIESQKGKGTKVTICFAMRLAVKESEPGNEEQGCPDLKGKRVLLVEDNEMNREIARIILEENGLLVEEAVDGYYAVEKIAGSVPGYFDFVLMDVQMPRMNGYEATRQIRALSDPVLSNVPIVAMTANAFGEDKEKAAEAGMNAHISKPVDFKALLDTLMGFDRWAE
ncbi:MAG: response regulator [Lachnospiraceae bacterium]|nr:response regulator [Lachnospiraceae bacterium]